MNAKKYDFSLILKVCREFDVVHSVGKMFHVRAASRRRALSLLQPRSLTIHIQKPLWTNPPVK